ncbi:tetratricopeptide (TPR) repeat protein [Chryseobacterium sediminis]|uniref:Tetratricopeptide (TPR) repeat protein n=1 Tax=Chryseobacterium sediminis TaxID=1679494 RepID=A0ABR6Q6I3_9FLAO|nr:tetratricopeptide repeat protein [Chryseobacterium sediminis]MBB6333351.1 tetratricopeptide (TPR) repeat protein [Chryseobacterium sediminis]
MDFKLEKELMKTSDLVAYQIEKLTSDSLIVIQKVTGIDSPDKIRKMWFIKSSIILNNFVKEKKNDSVIIASENFTPALKRNIISEIFDNYSQKDFSHDFNLKGNILIFPKKQKIEVETENKDQTKANQKGIAFFKTTLEKNYHLWDLTGFEKFEKIIIPYNINSRSGNLGNEVNTISIVFHDYSDDTKGFPVSIKNKKLSLENFDKGVDASNSNKFEKAIQFFNEAHEYDNTNTDALYNIVSISIAQNKTDVACTALKKLKDLDQKEGIKLYNEKCSGK